MAAPAVPQNIFLQNGNGQIFLSWDLVAGATSYSVQRSTDGVIFSVVTSPIINSYLDTTVVVGTNYFYQVASVGSSGTSSYAGSSPSSIVAVPTGKNSLKQIRLMAQQRADRVNSNFLTLPEWNQNINQSAFELYDLLTTVYEDYYVTSPLTFQLTGAVQYALDTLAPNFYKLSGVDLGVASGQNAWVTLKKFNFIERNKYVYPNIPTTAMGFSNLKYRVVGSTITFEPTPSANQFVRVWYIPRMPTLLQDTDILDSINGWDEYVIVDAAIKALQKEESDVSILMQQKEMLRQRIMESASNRDAGAPDTISDSRAVGNLYGFPWDSGSSY